MNRLKQAWLALCGKPEVREVVREVIREVPVFGEPGAIVLYRVTTKLWYEGYTTKCEYEYFATCEQAHATHPDTSVVNVKALRIGSECWVAEKLQAITVQPKPKVAKGKR
jgi:hypothetical protein